MKILILVLVLMSSINADEMQRIESIVGDIAKLRVDYEACQKQLKQKNSNAIPSRVKESENEDIINNLKYKLKDEKQKNVILNKEISDLTQVMKNKDENVNKDRDESKLKLNIAKLEKLVKNQEEVLKTKDNIINNLNSNKSNEVKTKDNKLVSLKNENISLKSKIEELENRPVKVVEKIVEKVVEKKVVCKTPKKENSFPKLMMKDDIAKVSQKSVVAKASAYRFKMDADVYDAIKGNKLVEWEKDTSFTSNMTHGNWVKITGYFVDKKWRPSDKEMWVKRAEVLKR